MQYEQQPEFPIPKLAHHHGTELIKVHGARAIFIDLFNDAVQVLRGQPVNEKDKLVSVPLKSFLDLKRLFKVEKVGYEVILYV